MRADGSAMATSAEVIMIVMLGISGLEVARRIASGFGEDSARSQAFDPSERPLWRALGRRHKLRWKLRPGPHYTLHGAIDGVQVAIEWPDGGQFDRCGFRARLSRPLPEDTLIQIRGEGEPPGVRTGHPILDSAAAANAPDEAALRARLLEPGVCEALLAVVHQWPGSTVTADEIHLSFPLRRRLWMLDDWLTETAAPLSDVLKLAAALRGQS